MATDSGDLEGAPPAPVIDVHTHHLGHGGPDGPPDEGLARRLDDMDAAGIDRQVLSPPPTALGYDGDPAGAHEAARAENEAVAKAVALHPDRFLGFGTVPLQDVDRAVAAVDEALALGLAGIQVGTRVGDRALGHPSLRPFFEAAADRGLPLLVHGTAPTADPVMEWVVGLPTDVTVAATTLVLGGTLAGVPGVRICLAHGGGTLPWVLPRLARLWDGAADLVRRLWVDTLVYDRRHLAHLVEVMGEDRVLLGSCYPLPGSEEPAGAVIDEAAWYGGADLAGARGRNALAFLGLPG